jgi:NAD-dependent DNA ligase
MSIDAFVSDSMTRQLLNQVSADKHHSLLMEIQGIFDESDPRKLRAYANQSLERSNELTAGDPQALPAILRAAAATRLQDLSDANALGSSAVNDYGRLVSANLTEETWEKLESAHLAELQERAALGDEAAARSIHTIEAVQHNRQVLSEWEAAGADEATKPELQTGLQRMNESLASSEESAG